MKCTFMPGIASMSGTMAKNQNSILVAKRCRGDKPGHGRVYIMPRKSFERTRFTPNEVEAKKRFTSVQNMLTNLSPEQWKSYERNSGAAVGGTTARCTNRCARTHSLD